jgi:hypothetical protein
MEHFNLRVRSFDGLPRRGEAAFTCAEQAHKDYTHNFF